MTDDDDPMLSAERLARYEVPGATAGFSTRVMERIAANAAPKRAWRPRLWQAFAVAALVAVAIGAIVIGGRSSDASGARVAEARETIALGDRGVAVAEAGAELHWTVNAGAAVIEQPAGAVFYRVERGGPFEVHTPFGTVTVTGTCFSVEVTAMKNPIKKDVLKGAAIGAAIATAVVVTVYEGRVALANSKGQLHVSAGETAVMQAEGAPQARAIAANDSQASALVEARARIGKLEDELHRLHGDDDAMKLHHQGDAGRYYAPSPEALREMADTCWVAFDQPPFGTEQDPELVSDELATAVGVSAAERDTINRAYRTLEERDVDAIRRLYMELTGADTEAVNALSLEAVMDEIDAKSPPEEEIEGRRRYARERAGLDPVPSATELARRPPIERLLRIKAGIGNDAEAIAATVVGAKRARELRSHDNSPGWHHTVSDYGGCKDHF